MEHRAIDQLAHVAELTKIPIVLSRRERLERWADALERDPYRPLRSLGEIEWQPEPERALMRADCSALAIAYDDPVLRAAGLASDRLGDAMRFFELTEQEAHTVLCSCMHGGIGRADVTARMVRAVARDQLR
jgi:hypothetical protein